jgi:hypothetical protein
VKKQDLPQKICPACGRPFVWRKKWGRDWGLVIYCSNGCRDGKRGKRGAKSEARGGKIPSPGG